MTFNSSDRAATPDPASISVLVEALKQIHEAKTRPSTPNAEAPAEATPAQRYQQLRAGVEQAEAKARRREDAIERGLRKPSASATPFQETLYLRCLRAGRSAGRFRCDNRLGRPSDVRVVKRRLTHNGVALTVEPGLSIEPERFALEADASAVVAVTIDLSSLAELPAGKLETSLDLIMDETLALKLWIEVDVYELP